MCTLQSKTSVLAQWQEIGSIICQVNSEGREWNSNCQSTTLGAEESSLCLHCTVTTVTNQTRTKGSQVSGRRMWVGFWGEEYKARGQGAEIRMVLLNIPSLLCWRYHKCTKQTLCPLYQSNTDTWNYLWLPESSFKTYLMSIYNPYLTIYIQ